MNSSTVWRATETLGWPFSHALRLLILTGCRQRNRVTLDGTKSKASPSDSAPTEPERVEHIVPSSAPAQNILVALPWVSDFEFVFTIDGTKPSSATAASDSSDRELAVIEPWRVHD